MKIRVFLADDHIVFRQGLKTLLEDTDDVTVIGEADDGRKAVDMITRAWPDVALMDIGMPELNGIEATRQILKGNGRVKIIGLSMHVNERFVGEMLRAGASGYLCKQCDADEVLMAIRVVMEGNTYLSPSISRVVVESYIQHVPPGAASAFAQLSYREREVLQLLAEERTVKEIASELEISAKTVYAHQENLMVKLDIHTVAGLTKYAVREGITSL